MNNEPSDIELMALTANGDEFAYQMLVERWQNSVAHFLMLCTNDWHDAEELAQDVFVRVYRAAGSYRPTAKFNTWLFTIARNVCQNWRRKNWKQREPLISLDDNKGHQTIPDAGGSPRSLFEQKEKETRIASALAKLPERQRAALTLRAYEGMGYEEIATVLQCSPSAVKTLLFRARENIRRQIKGLK